MTELVSWWDCDHFHRELVVVSFNLAAPKPEAHSVSSVAHQTLIWVTCDEEQGSVRNNTSLEWILL